MTVEQALYGYVGLILSGVVGVVIVVNVLVGMIAVFLASVDKLKRSKHARDR